MMDNKAFSFGIKLKKLEPKFNNEGTYLECIDGNHNKFYYLYLRDNPDVNTKIEFPFCVVFHFGRMNTPGNTNTSKFKEFKDAEKALAKKMKDKIDKGYKRVDKPTNKILV